MADPVNETVSFERRDAPPRIPAYIGAGVALTLLLLVFGLRYVYRSAYEGATVPPVSSEPFPQPRLQVSPRHDLAQFRHDEEQYLSSYGWVDRKAGTVHIPIEDAMKRVVAKGIAGWPAAEP